MEKSFLICSQRLSAPTSDSTKMMSKQQLRRSSRFAPPIITTSISAITSDCSSEFTIMRKASNATCVVNNNLVLKNESITSKPKNIETIFPPADDVVDNSGLTLYVSPASSGKAHAGPSSTAHLHFNYVEKKQINLLPKIVSLASRLVPAVESKLNGASTASKYYGTTTATAKSSEEENEFAGLVAKTGTSAVTPSLLVSPSKSHGLEEKAGFGHAVLRSDLDTLEGEEGAVEARAHFDSTHTISNNMNISRSSENGGCNETCVIVPSHLRVVTAEETLMDIEADILLDSIRNGVYTPVGNFTSTSAFSSRPQHRHYTDDDIRSIVSFGSEDDDDGMRYEIQRLQVVVASLRHDLAGASFDSENLPRSDKSDYSVQTLEQNNVLIQGEGNSLWSQATAELAVSLKNWSRLTPDSGSILNTERRTGSGANATVNPSALYWAVALLWALTILLMGHSHFEGNVGENRSVSVIGENWTEVLDLLWRR